MPLIPPNTSSIPVGKAPGFSVARRIGQALVREFQLVQGGWEYRAREDQTILPPHTLVPGSQNVVTNTAGRIALVKGFILDGAAATVSAPILTSYDYFLHNGNEVNVRAYLDPTSSQGVLQMRTVSGTTVTWQTILSTLNSGLLRFTNFWDFNNELKDLLLFVDGSSTVYEWSAGLTTLTSATATTITNTGNTWAQDNFYNVNFTLGDSTTQFSVTNTSGTTYRYTFNGTGTDPAITATSVPTGMIMYVNSQNFNAANNGVFTVTGSSTNYFEVTNALGVVESNKAIGTGFIDKMAQQLLDVATGNTYTYRGGASTNTITNVTPSPAGIAVGAILIQKPRPYPTAGITAFPTNYSPDLISVLKNQIYYGLTTNSSVYVSKVNNYKDVTVSVPRVVGEGAVLTLDAPPVGFGPQEDQMYITCGKDFWFLTQFTLSADLTKESLAINRLKTGVRQAAKSQEYLSHDKNNLIFVSNEPVVSSLGRVADILQTPQISDLSAPIIDDMNAYDFSNGSIKYFRNFIYVAVPNEQLIRIYNQTDPTGKHLFWEAPVTYPIGRFSIIGGQLYGHSYNSAETYQLFNGYNFNGQPIHAVANFAYNNFGSRSAKKGFTEFYIEGYINQNTTLNLGLRKDLDGCATDASFPIDGSNNTFVCVGGSSAPLGKESLGIDPFGGDLTPAQSLPPKFRIYITMSEMPFFFELQPSFFNSGVDQQWEIIAFGAAINYTTNLPTDLIQ